MFSPRILLCLLAHWHFPNAILHWLVTYTINILFPHLVGEAEDIRGLVVNAIIDHLFCFVACMVHHTSGDSLGSVIWCSCAFASLPCFESLVLGCDGIIHFLIPPPSFMSPSVGLCCATHLLCCLQQTCLEFHPISSVIIAASVSTAGTCTLKTSWNQLRVWGSLCFHTFGRGVLWGGISIIISHTRSWCCRATSSPGITFTLGLANRSHNANR